MKNEENNMTDPEEIEDNAACDLASKPTGPIPAGYSNLSYPKCDKTKGTWYWYDPTVA